MKIPKKSWEIFLFFCILYNKLKVLLKEPKLNYALPRQTIIMTFITIIGFLNKITIWKRFF